MFWVNTICAFYRRFLFNHKVEENTKITLKFLRAQRETPWFSKTTEDLSIQIKKLNLDTDQYQQLVQALVLSDFVKYAKYQSTEEERRNSVESIKESIVAIENSNIPTPKLQTSVS